LPLFNKGFGELQVSVIRDVVATFHAIRFVSTDLHADHLRQIALSHVPDSRAAQVVEEQVRDSCSLRCPFPADPEIYDAFT